MDYALQMFEQAIQLDPNFALAHAGIAYMCGLIFQVREQNPKWIERGLAACDRATALAPDLPEVLVAHARIFYAQKKYDESAMAAQRAIERKPDCEGSWNILGRAYFAAGRFEEAAALTERAIEANGDDYNTYVPYMQALERLGRKKEAENVRRRMIEVLRKQLELVPEDVRARILLATNLASLHEDEDEIMRHLQTAVALRPGDPGHPLQRRLHLRCPREESRGARDDQEGVCGRIQQPGLGGQGHRSRLPARRPRIPETGWSHRAASAVSPAPRAPSAPPPYATRKALPINQPPLRTASPPRAEATEKNATGNLD